MTVDEVAAALPVPVVGSVPQLWGRSEPNLGFGAARAIPQLDEAVAHLHAALAGAGPLAARV
jgi:hypothetical protein